MLDERDKAARGGELPVGAESLALSSVVFLFFLNGRAVKFRCGDGELLVAVTQLYSNIVIKSVTMPQIAPF